MGKRGRRNSESGNFTIFHNGVNRICLKWHHVVKKTWPQHLFFFFKHFWFNISKYKAERLWASMYLSSSFNTYQSFFLYISHHPQIISAQIPLIITYHPWNKILQCSSQEMKFLKTCKTNTTPKKLTRIPQYYQIFSMPSNFISCLIHIFLQLVCLN